MMVGRSELAKNRYAEDPEYRRRTLERNRARYAAHKADINARLRRKWATDAEFRRRCMARARDKKAERRLKSVYGISSTDYDAMLARQNGACAICEEKSVRKLCVDHCHATGVVRGFLCHKCNNGLGCYDDDPPRMLTAIGYLRARRGIRS